MMTPAHIASSDTRREVLEAYGILDTPREREFDEVTELVARICEAPMALISLLDGDRQWFKSEYGFGTREIPIEQSICIHALQSGDLVEITDTLEDPRSRSNPLCTGAPHLRFYAGAVLRTPAGIAYGTLCVLDTRPRRLSALQRDAIRVLARQVVKELDLRLALRRQDLLQREMDHRVKNSLQSVASFVRVQAAGMGDGDTRETLANIGRKVASVALLHQELYSASVGEEIALDSYMDKIAGLFRSSAPEGVSVEVGFGPCLVTAEQATALAAIANEFVTNSFKHAFPHSRGGRVVIEGTPLGDGTVQVTLRDNGVGLPHSGAPRGLGMRIIEASVDQMGARMTPLDDAAGTGLRLVFHLVEPTGPASMPIGPATVAGPGVCRGRTPAPAPD